MNLLAKASCWATVSLIATSAAFCQDNDSTSPKTPILFPGYNAPSRIEVRGCLDIFATASFTYWNPAQDNMELGIISNTTDVSGINGEVVDANFGYVPGFKVGIGANTSHDSWDTYLQYTWFRSTQHINVSLDSAESEGLFPSAPVPDFNGTSYFEGKEKWKLGMDLLDFELGRSHYVGTKLSFRPFFGLRGAWIRQKVDIDYLDATNAFLIGRNASITQKSQSWAIGPRIGLYSNWMLGKGVRLYGNGTGDILFTQYTDLSFEQEFTNAAGAVIDTLNFKVRQRDANYLRGHLELELGLGWGTYFSSNKYHIDLSAGYGFQLFFDQNMFRNFVDDQGIAKSLSSNGNLYMSGLTANVRFDF